MNVDHDVTKSMAQTAVRVARRWVGTPYRHQASVEGAGCDCLGLLRGIWRELYGREPEPIPSYSFDWAEPQGDERLWRAANLHLHPKRLEDEKTGDVLLFRMRDGAIAKHLGVQSTVGATSAFVHAYDRHGVIESPLALPWRKRIVGRFAFSEETT